MDVFERFFFGGPAEAEEIDKRALAEATDVLTFSQHPEFARLLSWLEGEIDKPVPLTKEMATIEAAVRQNTLKEVRKHLRDRAKFAQDTMDSAREERHA